MHKFAPFACHECKGQAATALVVGVFVCPRHPATGFEDLARRRVPLVKAMCSSCRPWSERVFAERVRSAVSLLEISLPEGA